MMRKRSPLADPAPLIRKVYAYVAYRIGHGPDAEDITSEVFERALRYQASYDSARGDPLSWLIGIARRRIAEAGASSALPVSERIDDAAPGDLESETVGRITLATALARLDDRDRELIGLRYGADLSARTIAALLDLKTNAVEVALHRAKARLRAELEREGERRPSGLQPAPGAAPSQAKAP